MKFELIDLFCGAGGVTTGIENARYKKHKIADVIACINHDPKAIESHATNHKGVLHFTEDIKTFDVKRFPEWTPGAITCLWASLECTNFSKAKGGKPRDADSRTLANHLFRYIEHLSPDYILIENVEEFESWGAVDENGKPISRDNGRSYRRWCNKVKSYGYKMDKRKLNAADFGANTIRKRLFIIFAKEGFPISWAQPTHSKTPDMYINKAWKPVKECLDFSDEGNSIFTRKKPLSERTLERIYAGLIKFIAKGDTQWILKYNSMSQNGKHVPPSTEDPSPALNTHGRIGLVSAKQAFIKKYYSGRPKGKVVSVEAPGATITTNDHQALVQTEFLINYNHGIRSASVENPSPTLTTSNRFGKISPEFLIKYHGNGNALIGMDDTCSTLSTKDRLAKLKPEFFIDIQHTQGKRNQSINEPLGSILNVPKQQLVKIENAFLMDTNFDNIGSSLNDPAKTITASRHHHYIVNPQYNSKGCDINKPAPVLIARMDKSPPYLVTAETGEVLIRIFDTDSEAMVKIKLFMAEYGIIDIKMRMLKVPELLKIQGFPKKYKLIGSQADRKKFIGNSVVPVVAQRIIEALYLPNLQIYKEAA